MPGDPADVRGTEMNLARLILEDIYKTIIRENHIPAAGMNDTFRLSRRTRSIKDEQHILRLHDLGRAGRVTLGLHLADLVFPPDVPSLDHTDRDPGTREHDHPPDSRALD